MSHKSFNAIVLLKTDYQSTVLLWLYLRNAVVKSSLAKQVTFSSLKNKSATSRVRKRVLLMVALAFLRSIQRLII